MNPWDGKMAHLSRRTALALLGLAFCSSSSVRGQLVDKDPYDLKPGEFTWHPERSGNGPLSIIVSLPEQLVFVYRNDIRVASSTCSTGRPGHATPTGIFTILQKDRNHHSATYDDAPMPNMNRLTWAGVALHAGNLPGYPASHGCVRLPLEFSDLLFGITYVGTPVIIASAATQPANVTHPGMTLSAYAEEEFEETVAHLKKNTPVQQASTTSATSAPAPTPASAPMSKSAPIAAVISSADKKGYLFEGGVEIAQGTVVIDDPGTPLGSHMFTLAHADDGSKGLVWHAFGYHTEAGSVAPQPGVDVIKRIRAAPDFVAVMQSKMHPGLVLVLTDKPASIMTRTSNGFVVLSNDRMS